MSLCSDGLIRGVKETDGFKTQLRDTKLASEMPLVVPINHAVFIVRLQLNYHLDFLTSTFISESFLSIGSKCNPSFHLHSLPEYQFFGGGERSDF